MTERKSYAGKWVAWSEDLKRICASADTPEELRDVISFSFPGRVLVFEYIPENLEPVEGQ